MLNKLMQYFLNFEESLENNFGYHTVIVFEDITIFFSGLFVGALIMTCILSKVFTKSKRIEGNKFNGISLIRFFDGDKRTYFINDNDNVFEAMRVMLLITFSPWFTIKSYTKRDEKRTKIFISLLFTVGFIFIILALFGIFTINVPQLPHSLH